MRRWAAISLAAALLCGAAQPASADPPGAEAPPGDEPSPERPASPAPAAQDAQDPGRTLSPAQRTDPAEYRGRPRETSAAEGLLWIPRVALLPAFAATEFGVRRPVYTAAEWTDRHHVVHILDRVFNPTPDISWFPIVSLDLTVNSTFGVKGNWRDLVVPGHDLKASFETGGDDNWRVMVRDQWAIGRHVYAGARGDFSNVPNRPFYGFGPRSPNLRTNFFHARFEGFFYEGITIDEHFRIELAQGYRVERTAAGISPSVETRFSPEAIPGFGDVQLAMAMLDFRIDSRRAREQNGGVRLAGNVTYAHDTAVSERSFASASLDLEAAVEVSYPDRVLAARAYAVETFALGREPVPFTHQAMLGWQNHVGFVWGRFRGETAVMAELQYRYPIAYFVDAQWTASAGNVVGERFEGLSVGSLTGSLGVGLRTRRAGITPVEVIIAVGTTRFDQPFSFDSARVYFGTTEGL